METTVSSAHSVLKKSLKFKNICLSLAVIATAVMPSCTDLEPEIYTDVLKDNYFTTTEQFSTLIANAYSNLAGEYGYVYREGYWSMQEYTSDEVVVPTRGTDWFDNGVDAVPAEKLPLPIAIFG